MKAKVRPRGTGAARVIQVIETKSMRGLGENDDPVSEIIVQVKDRIVYDREDD